MNKEILSIYKIARDNTLRGEYIDSEDISIFLAEFGETFMYLGEVQ